MAEVDLSIIAQRLISLRKHLSERKDSNLTIQELADTLGIPRHKMIRLEHGKGAMDSLITLLLFYRNQGYNLDWILFPDNASIPMMLPSGDDLLILNGLIQKLSSQLQQGNSAITTQLTKLGYSPLGDKQFTGLEANKPEVFDFSA